jgi:polysaccharide export outer membrane protein
MPSTLAPPPTDMVGPGDILNISIYEAGVALFAGSGRSLGHWAIERPDHRSWCAGAELAPSRVNDNGDIFIPYGGRLHVLGHTITEVETMIRQSLRRFSQNPQVSVTMGQVITNSIIMSGEVAKPGRLVLQTNRETLSDVIALAGGYRGNAHDLTLRVTRHNASFDIRMDDPRCQPCP